MNSATRNLDVLQQKTVTDAPVGWGAAMIDEQGNEVPITESMVARACEELGRIWVVPRSQSAMAV